MDDDLFEFWGALCDPHEIDDAFAATTASAAFAASESKHLLSADADVTATSASTQCPPTESIHVPNVAKSAGKVSVANLTPAPENSVENGFSSMNSRSKEAQSLEAQISSSSIAAKNSTSFVPITASSEELKSIAGPRAYAMSHSYSSLYSEVSSSKNVLAAVSDDEASLQDENTKSVSYIIK